MRIFSVALCVFISQTVRANNLTKPTFPNRSPQNKSKDENQNLAENENPSINSGPGNVLLNLIPNELAGISPEMGLLNDPDCTDTNNNPETSHSLNQYRDEGTKGQSSYKRVFVGRNSSGSEIYTSSPKIEHAVSLAENIRVVGGGLEMVNNRGDEETIDRLFATPLCKLSTRKERSSPTKHGKRTLSKRKDFGNYSECETFFPSAPALSLSRRMILSPELRSAYEGYMSIHREALDMASIDELECIERMFFPIGIEQPGPSGQFMQSDALVSERVSEHVEPDIPPSRPVLRQELPSEPSNSTSDQDSSTRLKALGLDDTEARTDTSLNSFVAAVNSLLTLVEDLDEYFGSARRLRTSIFEQPQQSFDVLEEISSYLRLMIIFSRPLGVSRLGTDSENRLIEVSDSIMYVNEEIWCSIIDFRDDENRDGDRGLVEYLLAILREFRNEVSEVIESAQLVMEYFQDVLNAE